MYSSSNQERYVQIKRIGHGSYAVVHEGLDTVTNERVAIKSNSVDLPSTGLPPFALREISTLKGLNHPSIIRLRDVVVTHSFISYILDLHPSNLHQLLSQQPLPDRQATQKFLTQILSGLSEIHSQRVVHRDLKPENILISAEGDAKIADFGLARTLTAGNSPYTPVVQTLWYRAPEVLLGSTCYSLGVDVWSAGCIFAEMLLGVPLFSGTSEIDQIHKVFSVLDAPGGEEWAELLDIGQLSGVERIYSLDEIFRGAEEEALDLLKKMLCVNPKERVSARAAMRHPYINGN